jgi:prepilin-type N-terminal cleavage/methylation domain-containing protein
MENLETLMTLETGKHSKLECRCAFTLIELVLVMTLLVVAVCMVAPRMSDFVRGRALGSEAQRMVALMHAGQSRAVSEGMPMVLWLDQKQSTCGLEAETSPKGGDPKAEDLTISENVQIAPLNTGTGTVTTFNHLPAIRFLPDGTIDENSPQTLQLTEGNDSLWLVELQNHAGYEINDSQK